MSDRASAPPASDQPTPATPKPVEHPPGLFATPPGVSLAGRSLTEAAVNNVVAFFRRPEPPAPTER